MTFKKKKKDNWSIHICILTKAELQARCKYPTDAWSLADQPQPASRGVFKNSSNNQCF